MNWDKYSFGKHLLSNDIDVSEEHVDEFFRTMFERQEIWYKRNILKQPAPWTDDPILRDNKFTNVYRQLDRSSQWIINTIMRDHSLSLEDYLFRSMVARFFNKPETFNKELSPYSLTLPNYQDFDNYKFWDSIMLYRQKVGNPWHTAYLMNPGVLNKSRKPAKGTFKDDVYANIVFTDVHKLIPELKKTLVVAKRPESIINLLHRITAVSTFMSHEFYIDFCYADIYWKRRIMKFDQDDYTNVGPGASTGIRILFPSLQHKQQKQAIYWLRDMAKERLARFGDFKYYSWNKAAQTHIVPDFFNDNITLHQIEMWLCEYQKYWKMKIGVGKQRSKFIPKT